ncbi:hypothetical protein ACLESO_05555 [Pyxidicoccus sp. 3LG]
MADRTDEAVHPETPGAGVEEKGGATAKPTPGASAPASVAGHATGGRDATSNSVSTVGMGPNGQLVMAGTVHIHGKDHTRSTTGADSRPMRLEWTNPPRPCNLPRTLAELREEDLELAARHLGEKHVLVIECIDSELQWGAAAAVIQRLGLETPTLRGGVSDAPPEHDEVAPEQLPRSVSNDIVHAQLGGGACVLLLELEGARGQELIDRLFKTHGKGEALSEDLRKLKRHLLLLPRGSAIECLRRDHSTRGFVVQVLRVDFLEPWLRRRFPDDAAMHAAKLQRLLLRGEWNGKAELLYEWLCTVGAGEAGRQRLQALLESGDPDHQELIARVEEALDCTDGAHEPLLAAVFVATFMPGLSQHDFVRTVEKLLEGSTRDQEGPTPGASSEGGARPVKAPLPPLKVWQAGLRPIMRRAHLEQRAVPGGGKVVDFQGLGTAPRLKPILESAPLFLDQQLERIRAAGLLFDHSDALGQKVIELVSMAAVQDPRRYNSDWLLGMLFRIDAEMKDIPLTVDTAGMHLEMLGNRHLAGARGLLRRLIDEQAAGDSDSSVPPRRHASSLVNQIFERLLRLGATSAASFLLELAWQLRDAPDFDAWHWIRQVLEEGNDESRDRAVHVLQRILLSEESDAVAEFHRLLSWLPEDVGPSGGQAAKTALKTVAGWGVASIQCVSGYQGVSVVTGFLLRVTTRGGSDAVRCLVRTLLRQKVVKTLFREHPNRGDLVAGMLLPPDTDSFAPPTLGAWLEVVADKWNATVNDLAADDDSVSFSEYLLPALTLVAWCELLSEQVDAVSAMAAELCSSLDEKRRTWVQVWLGILSDVMAVSEEQAMEQPDIDDAARSRSLSALVARRERIDRFQAELNRQSREGALHECA